MEPLARIALGRGGPAELPNLLAAIGLEPLPDRNRRLADLMVAFDLDASANHTEGPLIRIAMSDGPENSTAVEFASASAHAAATFILSQSLRLSAPFLTADIPTFDRLRTALMLGRGPGRIVMEGETGAGKQSLMRAVLEAANDRFVRIDCASYDDAGHNGEFTSAIKMLSANDDGLSNNAARGGILFLNHADELSLSAQRRLLSEIHAAPMIRPRIRYLATATRSLGELVERGRFVPELYNLFEVALTIPPLRERPADIAMLSRHFLRQVNPAMALTNAGLKTLAEYPFPGNVRELQNLITRLAIVPLASDGLAIGRPDVLGQLAAVGTSRWRSPALMAGRPRPQPITMNAAGIAPDAPSVRRGNSPIRPSSAVLRHPPKPPNAPRS
jgi:DNA-binding NtrC family response regulator